MSLTLSIISYRGQPPSAPNAMTFNTEEGSIGRRSDNSWVLEDPESYVSGKHALIDFQAPHYYLTDISANGVYLNQSSTSLGKGNAIRLADGDTLGIGDYEIAVSISEVNLNRHGANQPGYSLGEDSPLFPDDPFADLGNDPIAEMISDVEQPGLSSISDKSKQDSFPDTEPANEIYRKGSESNHVSDLHAYFKPATAAGGKNRGDELNNEQAIAQPPSLPENWMDSDSSDEGKKKDEAHSDYDPFQHHRTSSSTPHNSVGGTAASPIPMDSDQETLIVRRFLAGAGLEDDLIAQSIDPNIFFIVGQVLRTTVQGAMDVLMARAEIKNEMRLDVTTLRAAENNPIKFSVSVDDALTHLLAPQAKGYMPPVQAVEEAFEDIRAHQIAVLAGIQTALKSILKRFDPESLEQRLQKTSPLSASIPIHRQAKLWDLFEQLYEEIGREAEDDFNYLFGRAFVKAYEEQIDNIKVSQKHKSD